MYNLVERIPLAVFGNKSPIEDAYHDAVGNRLTSMVYFALNQGVATEDRKRFREHWRGRGSHHLIQLLLRCASSDWNSYPETFWVNPWVAEHLRACDENSLYYIIDQRLNGAPLPPLVSADPHEEDRKVRDLSKLFSALNR
jgi:hypothetical protein